MNSHAFFVSQHRRLYDSIRSVYCPLLNETVFFSSEGFSHLIYESNRRPRIISEQRLKLHCLKYAPDVIKKCQEISQVREVQRKIKGKNKTVVRYELVAEVRPSIHIRVIVERRLEKYFFLSVMPHQRTHKKRL